MWERTLISSVNASIVSVSSWTSDIVVEEDEGSGGGAEDDDEEEVDAIVPLEASSSPFELEPSAEM